MKHPIVSVLAAFAILFTTLSSVYAERKLQTLSRIHCSTALKCSTERCNVREADGSLRPMTDAEMNALAVYYARNCGISCILDVVVEGKRRICSEMIKVNLQ
jgi:hypothetical protein